VEVKDWEDDDWIGVEYVIDDVPLAEFDDSGTGEVSITREGDEFVVAGTMDLSGGVGDDPSATAMLEEAELEISITFPGGIVSSNGEEDGNTVTWTPVAGEVLELDAVGKAESGPPWGMIGGAIAVLLLVVVGVVLFLVVRGRQPAPAAGPLDDGSIDPDAYGVPPAAAAPDAPSAGDQTPGPPASPPTPPPAPPAAPPAV
jgi:hypothetical protein